MGAVPQRPTSKGKARILSPENLFSAAALREIDRRWNRLAREAGLAVADRFLATVFETATLLRTFPRAGMVCEITSPQLRELRRIPIILPFDRWLMVYRVRGDQILILRVLHGSQDWQRFFG